MSEESRAGEFYDYSSFLPGHRSGPANPDRTGSLASEESRKSDMLRWWEAEYQTGSSCTEKALEFCRVPLKSFTKTVMYFHV